MAESRKRKTNKLSFTREQIARLYDITLDYSLQLQAAEDYYTREKESLKLLLKSAEDSDAAKEAAKLLTALDKDKAFVDIAKQRHAELSGIMLEFLGPKPEDVKKATTEGVEGVDVSGDEQVHSTNKEEEVVSPGQED